MQIEHVNITVPDPKASAAKLCELFGWHVRWQGDALNGGFTVHVGDEDEVRDRAEPRERPRRAGVATALCDTHVVAGANDAI